MRPVLSGTNGPTLFLEADWKVVKREHPVAMNKARVSLSAGAEGGHSDCVPSGRSRHGAGGVIKKTRTNKEH